MKKFNFRLEQVLKIRAQQEKVVQREFAIVQANYQKTVKALRDLFDLRKNTIDDLKKISGSSFDQRAYLVHMRFVEKLNIDIDIQRINVQKAEVELSKKRKDLLEAVKKRKIIEKLKEKKLEEYAYEANSEEQKNLDEVASRIKVVG